MSSSPLRNLKPSVALIGCGKMGSALLRGWLSARIVGDVFVLEPAGLPDEFQDEDNVSGYDSAAALREIASEIDVVVLAVKPQIMAQVCPDLKDIIPANAVVLSIAAGQTIGGFENYFGTDRAIVRSMPNTPAAIGEGITVAVTNKNVSAEQKQIASALLRAIGQVEWVDDEKLLDPVTALSGSGPAYLFYLIEVLAEAGTKAGLDKDFAMRLARQTMIGSAALAEADARTPAATLRKNVTSPGGTTAAAMDVLLKDNRMQSAFDDALAAATARSIELSK
ncbi:pyrroline-5-carboxylate reductase [Micavibrio aeruginosavorus]|uniref:Pyrroline-5-carboxylate reductase n=1 Tax=Micavibrio aeruginosavorus (strain ARL-13) TaxID=856793 RepID=G2KSH9_MICAA|nr:pyrroline-5-carboxylate reductase [Micavibrio aeruginosavorus]AEP09263.1 pyrroline-5-carboxylate reductase [Micavibrio aeruginosavorus ARL-13]